MEWSHTVPRLLELTVSSRESMIAGQDQMRCELQPQNQARSSRAGALRSRPWGTMVGEPAELMKPRE